jgi:homoserine kinase
MTEAARNAGAIGACLSGAGPTILALTDPADAAAVEAAYLEVAAEHAVEGRVAILAPTDRGAHLLEEESARSRAGVSAAAGID